MSSKRVRIILLSGIILIALIIGVSLILTYCYRPTTVAALPETGASVRPADNELKNVTVGVGNVQAVIETLRRPVSYSRSIKVESFFANSKNAVYTITASVRGRDTAMLIDGSGFKKNVMLAGGMLYIWYDGDKDYYSGPADSLGKEPNLSDEFQMILTYEDILELEKSSILDAGFTSFGGEDCIYVRFVSGALNYTTTGYISVKNGLVTGADQYDGAILVYSMTTSGFNPAEPASAAFNLPDGKNALNAP